MLTKQQAIDLEAAVIGEFRTMTGLPVAGISLARMSDGGYGFKISLRRDPRADLPSVVAGAPVNYRVFVEPPALLGSKASSGSRR